MKKPVALFLATVLSLGVFAGCAKAPAASTPASAAPAASGSTAAASGEPDLSKQEPVTLKIYTLVPEQADQKAVMDAVNQYTQEKLNTTVEYYFQGGAFTDKIQVIMAGGEEYDACFTSNWANSYTTGVAKGAFLDISKMLPEVAPKLYASMPEAFWKAATINGGIYAVPNQQIAARTIGGLLPKEYLEGTSTDIATLKTLTGAGDYAQKAFDQFGAKVGGVNVMQAADYCGYEYIADYMAAGVIKMDDTKATVVNLYETPEWLAMLNELYELNKKGLLDGQCAYMPEYGESQRLAKKTSLFFSGTYKPGVEAEESTRAGYDCAFATTDVAPYMSTSSIVATMYGVSATSKNPERLLQYLELVSTDPYLMNLLSYGIEGTHYKKTGDKTIELIPDSGYAHGQSWALGNVFNTYVLPGQPENVWEETKTMNENAKSSPILGFSFNPEPIKMQLASVAKVVKEFESIVGGELEVEKTNTEFNEKLKTAGVEDIIKEMQTQIDAFLAGK